MRANGTDASEVGGGTVQSVDRALVVLELIANAGGELGITELAGQLGVHKSTASRLVATLEAHELVEQTQERGKYRLGLGLMRLSAAANLTIDLVRVSRPALTELVREVGETVNLAVLSDDAALYIDQLVGNFSLQAHSWVGQRIPLHATSNGKVLLAYGEPRLLDEVLALGLAVHGPKTIVDADALRADLAIVRERGWALAQDELEEGLTAVAAPIFDVAGDVVGSVSVSGPGFRVNAHVSEFAAAAMEAGIQASRRLGYRGAAVANNLMGT